MGKSSLKKKRSKNSSQLRMSKKNKVKSKKSKSKKLRRQRDDSVSCSGDSDSTSMVSVSSSSSEDHYRSRKSRSRNRKDVKLGKKRARKRSSSRESSEDFPCVKKRRGSKRDDTRKRTGKRKKSRRGVSVSSGSSQSLCCSTSPSDGDEIGYEKRRGRSEKKEKHGRRSEKVKRGSKRSKGRSRSCSSCSRYNDGSDHSIEEGVMEESNSRRLKSIITVVKQENESSRELITDDPKEEDVYDYDDYPSCRSNDSNDGCSRKELRQHPLTVSETKRSPDDEQVEVSNIGTSNVEEINVPSVTGGLNGDDIESILRQRALENLKKFRGRIHSNVNPPVTSNDMSVSDVKTPSSVNTESFQIKTPKADDGEMVIASQVSQQIKQPLVRRGSSTFPKNDRNTSRMSDDGKYSETLESDVAFPSARVVPTGIPRIEVNTANNSVSNKPKLVMSRTGLEAPNTRITQKQAAAAAWLVPPGIPGIEVNKDINSISNKPKLVKSRTGLDAPNTRTTQKQAAESQEPSQTKLVSETSVDEGDLETAGVVKPSEDNAASVSNRPKSFKLRIGQEPSDTQSTQKEESTALESCQAKLMTESSVNESSLRTAQNVNPGECGNTGDSTCEKPSSSESISSDKQEDETKDGQFQQKTMSVMRGGEMVQVSYQVYIPKRAAALARRQLKR